MKKTLYTIFFSAFLFSFNSYAYDGKWLCENVKTPACTEVCGLQQKNEFDSSNANHTKLSIDCSTDSAKAWQSQNKSTN